MYFVAAAVFCRFTGYSLGLGNKLWGLGNRVYGPASRVYFVVKVYGLGVGVAPKTLNNQPI